MSGFLDAMSDPDINPLAGVGQSLGDSAFEAKEWVLKSTEYVEQHLKQIMHEVWQSVVGKGAAALDWLEALALGEFAQQPKSLSIIITEALAMFTVPNSLLVISARDAAAVGWRLYSKPGARDEWTEWLVFFANIIGLTVPLAATAVGALAAGVGAIVGNLVGDKIGAFLRTTAFVLIVRGAIAEETAIRYFNEINLIVKGKITPLLEKINFMEFVEPMKKVILGFTNQVIKICKALREAILKIKIFGKEVGEHIETIMRIHKRLQEIEDAYFAIQYRAIAQVGKAMTELDKALKEMLAKMKNKPVHDVVPGQSAHAPEPVIKSGAPVVERQSPGAQEIDDHSKKYHQERQSEPQGTHHEVPGSPGHDTSQKPASTGVTNVAADAAHAHAAAPPKPLTDGEHPNVKVEGGGDEGERKLKPFNYKADLDARVKAETDVRVAAKSQGQALAKAGISREKESDFFENILFPRGIDEFPGLKPIPGAGNQIKIIDENEFIKEIEEQYKEAGQPLNKHIRKLIMEHIKVTPPSEFTFDRLAGIPGLHAEVRAANDFLNKFGKVDEPIIVPTYKLDGAMRAGAKPPKKPPKVAIGDPFPACSNCSGILVGKMFDVMHGRYVRKLPK